MKYSKELKIGLFVVVVMVASLTTSEVKIYSIMRLKSVQDMRIWKVWLLLHLFILKDIKPERFRRLSFARIEEISR